MPIPSGTHKLGPDNATLLVKTGRHGAAAMAGHNLVIEVTSWDATLDVGDRARLELTADPTSLQVITGEGGMQALDDDSKADIRKSIDKDVLKKKAIKFASNRVEQDNGQISVQGELELNGKTKPLAFDVGVGDDGTLSGSATFKQTDWGIKIFSALFGALKVDDEVEVVVEAKLPAA